MADFFHPCDIYCDCPSGVPRGGQNVLKWRTFFIHVTFTVIVPVVYQYPGEAKMCPRPIAETDARSVTSVGDCHPFYCICCGLSRLLKILIIIIIIIITTCCTFRHY